ncbi:MAG: hypothetical protein NC411_02320 [Bacteroides sp.]|nr:hypothetical protein [Bacteroides sp.]
MLKVSKTAKQFSIAFMMGILSLSPVMAQGNGGGNTTDGVRTVKKADNNVFRHLDAGLSIGSTGIGIDLSSHIGDHVRVRAGVDFTPHIAFPMSFSLQSYTDGGGVTAGNFDKLQRYMEGLTGIEVDDRVDLDGKPTMTNFKLLVDVYPWKSKGWRVTAGFYAGSRRVAKALNTMGEMPSLVAVNIYNHFYDFIMSDDAINKPIYGDTYLDPFLVDDIRADLAGEGQMGIHVGDFKDGRPYMMQPDKDGMVKVSAFVNAFKPYVGLGYSGDLGKTKKWKFDVDCGMMIWGGSPKLLTHDGTDLTNDVEHIKGKPGDYVDLMTAFKVYPVLSFRIAYKLF